MLSTPSVKTLSGIFALLFAVTVLSCHKSVSSPGTGKPLDLPAGSQAIITAGNQFAFDFFGTVLQTDTLTPNKLISPFSIDMALSMLYNGSANATKDSIAKTLDLTGIPLGQVNAVSKALIGQMPTEDSKVTLSIANSLWYQQNGPQPLPSFEDSIKNAYNGYLQALDFANPASVGQINSWVARNTNNKITSILDHLDPAEVMILVNAIYFNGSWQYGFDPSKTQPAPFYLRDGSTVSTPFMSQRQTLRMYNDPAYTLLELPYGNGSGYDMDVVLPTNQQQSLTAFATTFNGAAFATGLSRLDSSNIGLFLPTWGASYTISSMLPNLSVLGMGNAMSQAADFSNMSSTPSALSQAIHKTYIKVSESGTEAAAVTELGMTLLANGTEPPAILVNHPFLYFITEKQTGAILFIGMVDDPTKN
jgi:serine protease inhibitor